MPEFMSAKELAKRINTDVGYKPWVKVKATVIEGRVEVKLSRRVIDSTTEYDPTKLVINHFTRIISPPIQSRVLTLWLRQMFHDYETHEADEWFRIKDKLVTKPHD